MNNNTVVQLKAIAKQRGIRGYYKLRKAEFIHALEAMRLVEQKSNIFDESISNDPTPILQPNFGDHQMPRQKLRKIKKISLLRVCKRLKFWVNGCLITYHLNQKWLTKWSSLSKTKLKKLSKRGILCSNQYSPNLL